MRKALNILLVIIMVAGFGVAISYPILYKAQQSSNETTMDQLRALREAGLQSTASPSQTSLPEDQRAVGMDSQYGSEPSVEIERGVFAAQNTELEEQDLGSATVTDGETVASTEQATGKDVPNRIETVTEQEEQTESVTAEPETMVTATEGVVNATAFPDTAEPQMTLLPAPRVDDTVFTDTENKIVFQTPQPTAIPTLEPTPMPTRDPYSGALAFPNKEKVLLKEEDILPEYREIYALNHDLVGWIVIDGIGVDYPVMQNEDDEYYLHKDFNGNKNSNGQMLVFNICDVFTPSYNVVISGHNMKSGKMFGELTNYARKTFWEKHKTFTFDTILRRGTYVVVAAFYSANYDEDEEGFRYLADIQYPIDYRTWIDEVKANALYDTGIDTEFGDEFVTLTTCAYQRKNGRFVVIARRLRESEIIE